MNRRLDWEQVETIRRTMATLESCKALMQYIAEDYSDIPGVSYHAEDAIVEIQCLCATFETLLDKHERRHT